jgi:hypothetical protein
VEFGPLAGIEGTIIEVKSKCRLIVSVSLLQRSVFVEIDRDWVVPAGANERRPTAEKAHATSVGRV